jgi:predicted Holliday junction resolvase-like endonuclease
METVYIVILIIILVLFIAIFSFMNMPKIQSKMLKQNLKSLNEFTKNSKDELIEMNKNMGNISIESQDQILDENEDKLKDIATKEANISKKGVEITARSIKKGLTEEETYCKHCGKPIDADSEFCKHCGKKQ